MCKMKILAVSLVAILALFSSPVTGYHEREGEEYGKRFVLDKGEQVVKTDGGEVRVVRGRSKWDGRRNPMHIGFISMEPNTLFVPQYIDADLILFVRKGKLTSLFCVYYFCSPNSNHIDSQLSQEIFTLHHDMKTKHIYCCNLVISNLIRIFICLVLGFDFLETFRAYLVPKSIRVF